MRARSRSRSLVVSLVSLGVLVGCGPRQGAEPAPGEARGPVTVYSGRSEALIGPILDRFTEATGIDVETRYGSTADLAATLLEEGDSSPAALFIGQDAGALGAIAEAGLFVRLPQELLDRVPPRFRSADGSWIGLSGRPRVVCYNTELIGPEELPKSLEGIADPKHRGKFGIAPPNASFQAHMAVYRVVNGAEALRRLLEGIAANEPQLYRSNTPIVAAVIAGEIEWGLTNHYYLWRALKEDPEAPAVNWFMPDSEASSFVNVAGAGALNGSAGAMQLLEYLVSDEGQRYFAEETFEYPMVAGIESPVDLQPLDDLRTPAVDFAEVSAVLQQTVEMLRETGLLQ